MRSWMIGMLLVASVAICGPVRAQQTAAAPAADMSHYDFRRETNIVGRVVAFTPNSQSAPFGARVTLQTRSGTLEIHLGDPRFLSANHFSLQTGDTLRILGEPVLFHGAQQFVARIIQKGPQALEIRNSHGMPIPYVAPRAEKPAGNSQGVV